jgi:hypothetical protein
MNPGPHTPVWRKSSYSDAGPNCVELADAGDDVFLRDSKNPDQGHFTFTSAEIAAFVAGVKAGEFDHLAR